MPVVTRSCGRNATTRRRIEDPTPRACRTAKRKKDVSDEEIENPPKKKPSIEKTVAAPKMVCDKKNEGVQKSRIPRRCLSEKKSVRIRSQVTDNKDDDNDDDELTTKSVQTRSHITKNKDHTDEVDKLMTGMKKPSKTRNPVMNNKGDDDDDDDDEIQFKTTVEEKNAGSPQEMNVQCEEQQTPLMSPAASRTRSYSMLKKSYMKKKQNKEIHKTTALDGSLISTSEEGDSEETDGEDSLQEREEEAEAPYQVTEINSSTCEDENNPYGNSNDKEMNDDSFKKKFLEVVQTLKKMQEEFDQAHQKTCENIAAYDAFIKDLKSSLEQEKRKNATTEEELKQTKEQLLMTQKEIEWAKTIEQQQQQQQQQHMKSINTPTLIPEPSQSSQSESEESEKTETSTLLAMIKFYRELTGITLSTDTPPSNSELIESFCCAYRPKGPTGKVMQFRLMYDKEIEEYEYSPRFQSPKRGEFLYKLSEHFKDHFYFNNDQAHSFLASLIKAVKNL